MAVSATALAACSEPKRLPPAPYVPPAVGAVYEYIGFKNSILESEGWRVRFADDKGRQGLRFGLFVTEDAAHPAQFDSTELARLWPLQTGKQVVFTTRSANGATRWMFDVVGQAQVAVPAGTFDTYVVQAVQRPDPFTDPKTQTTFAFTWWYAPQIAAVVRFETRYYSGPMVGQVVRSALRGISTPSAKSTDRAAGR